MNGMRFVVFIWLVNEKKASIEINRAKERKKEKSSTESVVRLLLTILVEFS